jgi:hypothetical protein
MFFLISPSFSYNLFSTQFQDRVFYKTMPRMTAKHEGICKGCNKPIHERPLLADDPHQRQLLIEQAKKQLGWEPKVPF